MQKKENAPVTLEDTSRVLHTPWNSIDGRKPVIEIEILTQEKGTMQEHLQVHFPGISDHHFSNRDSPEQKRP